MLDRIRLPAASVVQASTSLIGRARSQLAAMYWIDAMFVLGFFSFVKSKDYGTPEMVGGIGFWVVVLGLLTLRFKRKVNRALAIDKAAKNDPTITWVLNGRQLVGVDQQQVPQVHLSAKITNALHATLTAVPAARVLER